MNPFPSFRVALIIIVGFSATLPVRAAGDPLSGPWPSGAAPAVIGRRITERFLSHDFRLTSKPPVMHYAETCAWYGALQFAQLTHEHDLTERLVARFESLLGPQAQLIPPPTNVDYAVFGALPLELYRQTRDERYRKLGLDLADRQWTTPVDQNELSPEAREAVRGGLSWHTRFWIDDMYMITMLQTQAYRATHDQRYLDRAAAEAVAYLDKLQQPNGLFLHAPDTPFYWARGNGWFAAGMSELLSSLPANHPRRERILAGYRKMMAALRAAEDAEGMWHQLLDEPQSFPESSGTAMFTFAFISGVKHGWLEADTYAPAARRGWLALVSRLEPDGALRDVCESTNKKNDREYYLTRQRVTGDLHGQAPMLWCVDALLR